MSLLMDALKRAEKARQAQAEKNAEGQDSSTSELTLDPIEVDPPGSGSANAAPSEPEPEPEPQPEPASSIPEASARTPEAPSADADPSPAVGDPATTHFSLEDDFPSTEKVPPPKSTGGPPEPAGEEQQEEKLGPFSLLRDDELSLEDTGEMLPVVQEAERSLNRHFDEPDSATTTAGPEKTFGDDDSTVLGGRGSRESDSQARQAAESVFKAKAPAVARYQRNRKIMLVLPLLLIGVIAIGLLLFWGPLERAIFGAPPVLVQRPPGATELPPPQAAPPVDPAKLAAAAAAASAGQQPAEPAPSAQTAATASTVPETAPAGAPEPVKVAPAAAAPVAAAATPAPAGSVAGVATKPVSAALPKSPPPVSEPPPAMARPFAGATTSGVRISRRSNPDAVHAGIHAAYMAFQRGEDARARALYAEVRRQHPNNRNALLGLGAIAVRGGNYSEAIEHYARLLSINPRDPIAGAALINLNQRVPAGEGESHVKRLLAEDPEQPFLYFTLGNLYSRQGRWLEAQQAYFDAYRRDSENADFAFNLAVSLDRLGEATTALTYYHRALSLAAEKPASFELSAARKRIQRLVGGGPG